MSQGEEGGWFLGNPFEAHHFPLEAFTSVSLSMEQRQPSVLISMKEPEGGQREQTDGKHAARLREASGGRMKRDAGSSAINKGKAVAPYSRHG